MNKDAISCNQMDNYLCLITKKTDSRTTGFV